MTHRPGTFIPVGNTFTGVLTPTGKSTLTLKVLVSFVDRSDLEFSIDKRDGRAAYWHLPGRRAASTKSGAPPIPAGVALDRIEEHLMTTLEEVVRRFEQCHGIKSR